MFGMMPEPSKEIQLRNMQRQVENYERQKRRAELDKKAKQVDIDELNGMISEYDDHILYLKENIEKAEKGELDEQNLSNMYKGMYGVDEEEGFDE